MEQLKENELKQVYGGGFSLGVSLAIASGIVIIVGILDGYLRPFSCRK